MKPRALILHADGTNRDLEAAQAMRLAGAEPEIVPLNWLRSGSRHWNDYQVLVVPGGFSYGDALGAGKLLALDLNAYFADEVRAFIGAGWPAIGICNGFQALVKAGLLPGQNENAAEVTLTFNASGRFECRWVTLLPTSPACVWTKELREPVYCPVAHGEGKFLAARQEVVRSLQAAGQVALVYADRRGQPAEGRYPLNPNGSAADIAGICNRAGTVLGLMPHPENHLFPFQHPRWTRGECAGSGLDLFAGGVRYAADL